MNTLQTTISENVTNDWPTNPAIKLLVDDYAKYHTVLAIAGSVVLLILVILTISFWTRFKRISTPKKSKWPFNKKVYFSFSMFFMGFSLFFGLVVAANVSTALKPQPGFRLLAESTTTAPASAEGQALTAWIQSPDNTLPPVLEQKAQDRISWQRPKAIICGILFIASLIGSWYVWSYLLSVAQIENKLSGAKQKILIAVGVMGAFVSMLLIVMTLANMQGSIAPVAISVLGASN